VQIQNSKSSKSQVRVSLFITVFVDQLWSAIGVSTVEVLAALAAKVQFDERKPVRATAFKYRLSHSEAVSAGALYAPLRERC